MTRLTITALLLVSLALLPSCGSGPKDGGQESTDGDGKGEKKKKTVGASGKKGDKKSAPATKPKELTAETLAKLDSQDPDERSGAIRDAAAAGEAATRRLLGVIESGTPRARTAALIALGKIGDSSARRPVEAFLGKAGSAEEMLGAMDALGRLGDASSALLLRKFLAYSAPVRFPPEAGFMVEKGRETEEGMVRCQAAESLARLGDYSGVPVLIENLLGNGWVRKDAIVRLRRMTNCKLDFGYNIGAAQDARAKAVEAWKKWWAESGSSFKPEWTDSTAVFDLTKN